MPQMPAPSRLSTIDALRGLAALSVSWFHFTNGNPAFLADSWIKQSGAYGWLGVEVFFVISGFIIPLSLARGGYRLRDYGTFVLKRVLRLDPPYVAAIVIILAVGWLSAQLPGSRGQPPDVSGVQVLLHLGYVNVFFGYPWLSPVFWTLALEFQYYLAIGLLFPLVAVRSDASRTLLIVALASMGFVLPATEFLFRWLPLFGIGIAVFALHTSRTRVATFAVTIVWCAACTAMLHGAVVAFVAAATGLLIAFATLPAHGVLGWLGKVSYSLYLLHVPIGGRVVNFAERYDLSSPMQAVVLLAAVAASLLAAWLLFVLVEAPARQWSSRLKYRRAASARVPAEAQMA